MILYNATVMSTVDMSISF